MEIKWFNQSITPDNNTLNFNMNSSRFKHGLQTIIPVSFVIILTAMVAVVVYTTQDIVRPVLLEQHERRMKDAGNMIVAKINGILCQAETVAVALADIVESLKPDAEAVMQAVPRILDRKGYESFIAGGGVWPEPHRFEPDKERRSFFWGRDRDGTFQYYDDYNSPHSPGYRQEEWYVPARYMQDEQAVWSRSYIDPYSHQPMVTCSIPIMEGKKFVGVTTVDLKLEGIASLFSQAAQNINGYVFAVDRNNRFLTFPQEELVLNTEQATATGLQKFITTAELAARMPDFQPVNSKLEHINRLTVELARREPGFRKDLAALLDAGSYQIDLPEAELITAIMVDPLERHTSDSQRLESFHIDRDIILHEPALATIFNMPETYWKVVIVVPEKSVTAPVNGITNRLMASMVLLISSTLLVAGFFLRRHLLVPLKNMTDQLKKIGADTEDLSLELDIPSGNELGELAYYFNKRTEALRNSEEKYRTIFNGAGEGISLSTLEGTFIAVNPMFAEIFDYDSPEELMATIKTSDLYVDIADRATVFSQLKKGADTVRKELWFRKKDRTRILVSLNLGAVKDRNGEILYLVAMVQDITRNKQLEEELRHAQKMEAIGTLAGGIAHDFNNILASISGYNEIAQMKAGNNRALAGYLSQIGVAADRARDLVRQILTFSRNSDQEKKPLKVAPICKEALKLLRSTIPSTIEIQTRITPVRSVLADPTGIHQIIMNLCTNAYYSMRETGGVLSVGLNESGVDAEEAKIINVKPGDYAVIEIRDTGSGMNSNTLTKIFEPYFTTKGKEEGTGLGLAVVHGIIKSLEGGIRVESVPGKGTFFRVYLPLIKDKTIDISDVRPENHAPPPAGNGQKIMFVDDEEMICGLSRFLLEDAGYRVSVFRSSKQALQNLQNAHHGWDILITDMTMPGISGEELIKRAREINPDLPIILCTGYSEVLTQERIDQLKLQAFLQKPVSRDTLLIEVGRILSGSPNRENNC